MSFKATDTLNPLIRRKRFKKKNEYLHKETLQQMIYRILVESRMSEEKLAHALGITIKKLKRFCSQHSSKILISQINLPLIKLYCATEFRNLAK
jgi:hypothetical protein